MAKDNPAQPPTRTVQDFWAYVFANWDSVTAVDLHQTYGIDVDDPGFAHNRRWAWLRARILGLLDDSSTRLNRWALEAKS